MRREKRRRGEISLEQRGEGWGGGGGGVRGRER
jgi:hypothetical protein